MSSIANKSALDLINTALAAFKDSAFDYRPELNKAPLFASQLPSPSGTSMSLAMLGANPAPRVWSAAGRPAVEKILDMHRAYSLTVDLQRHYAACEFDGADIRGDAHGVISSRLSQFLGSNQYFLEKILTDALVDNTLLGYDGVALVSNAHPHGPSGNQSNANTGTFSSTTVEDAIEDSQELRDENGMPFNVNLDTCMVGPALERKARQIFEADSEVLKLDNTGAEASSGVVTSSPIMNVFQGRMTVVVNRLLPVNHAKAYLIDSKAPAKPLAFAVQDTKAFLMDDDKDPARVARDVVQAHLEMSLFLAAYSWQSIFRIGS